MRGDGICQHERTEKRCKESSSRTLYDGALAPVEGAALGVVGRGRSRVVVAALQPLESVHVVAGPAGPLVVRVVVLAAALGRGADAVDGAGGIVGGWVGICGAVVSELSLCPKSAKRLAQASGRSYLNGAAYDNPKPTGFPPHSCAASPVHSHSDADCH